eukprot:1636444-Pleurochrysis_carterae.AAC.1
MWDAGRAPAAAAVAAATCAGATVTHARPASASQLGPASSANCAGDGPRRTAADAWAACLA